MSQFLQLQEISTLLAQLLTPFESAAFINSDGQILGMKYETIIDIGTFGTCAQTVKKYFTLKEGDVVLTNDPYSGGTIMSVMTLVTPVVLGDQNCLMAIRTRFKPRLAHAKKLDEEGLRIPPTPIASQRKLNEGILQAISAHPQAPQMFSARITERLDVLWQQIDVLKSWHNRNPETLSRNLQRAFISETRSRIQQKLSDLPHGDQRFDLQFETGEMVRLHTEMKSDGIHFDFAGTSNSKRLFLTDSATYGTCLAAVLAFLREDFVLNEGVYSLVSVTTPQGCFLNAQYPSPVFEGVAEAGNVIGSAVIQSLSSICSTRAGAMNGAVPTILSLEFADGKIYFDALAGGGGASTDGSGIDAYYMWSLNKLQPSIEEIERIYPIQLLRSGIRQGSGGKGKFQGGNGVLREIEVFEDCTLKWLLGHRNTQVKGLKGATSGQAGEIILIRKSGDTLTLTESSGQISLMKGDRITAASAGGGGYGKAGE